MTEHKLDALRHGRGEPPAQTVDLAGLDDDLAELIEPYTWLAELRMGTMRSWTVDLFWTLHAMARQVQYWRDKDRAGKL